MNNNINHDSQRSLEEVGEKLKKEREKNNYSLIQISEELRIQPRFLAAIEEGNFSDLPDSSVFFAFLRSYAKFLELNSEELVSQCKKNLDLLESFQGKGTIDRKAASIKKKVKNSKELVFLFLFLAFVLVFPWFFKVFSSFFLSLSKTKSHTCVPFEITAKQPVKIKITSKSLGLVEEIFLNSGEKFKFLDPKGTKIQINSLKKSSVEKDLAPLATIKQNNKKQKLTSLKSYFFKCTD